MKNENQILVVKTQMKYKSSEMDGKFYSEEQEMGRHGLAPYWRYSRISMQNDIPYTEYVTFYTGCQCHDRYAVDLDHVNHRFITKGKMKTVITSDYVEDYIWGYSRRENDIVSMRRYHSIIIDSVKCRRVDHFELEVPEASTYSGHGWRGDDQMVPAYAGNYPRKSSSYQKKNFFIRTYKKIKYFFRPDLLQDLISKEMRRCQIQI